MPPKSGTNRDLFPGHSAGKGDAERSPGWRDHYDIPPSGDMTGFKRVAVNRIRKVYGARKQVTIDEVQPPGRPVLVTNESLVARTLWVNMPLGGIQKAVLMPYAPEKATIIKEHTGLDKRVVGYDLLIFGGVAHNVPLAGLQIKDV